MTDDRKDPAPSSSRLGRILKAPFLSPAGLFASAVAIAATYFLMDMLGLREYATVLSGSVPDGWASPDVARVLGAWYVICYFACLVISPILLLASALLALGARFFILRKTERGVQ